MPPLRARFVRKRYKIIDEVDCVRNEVTVPDALFLDDEMSLSQTESITDKTVSNADLSGAKLEGRSGSTTNFIREIIEADLKAGLHDGRVRTRFPPEPNGYLHIGHAKSICLNFGLARDYNGKCNLRFDDTNPTTEDLEYVEAIQRDVRWLGFDWEDRLFFASDYFEALYNYAVKLIKDGKAYVDSQTEEEIRLNRGTVTEPGKESPYRNRTVEENLDLFQRMRAGEFKDGEHVLRAKMDMASQNMKARDPLLYRIRHATHYRTGDKWCIYPMYDFAHPLSDAIESITHSLCTLEFDNNREIYDWVLDNTVGDPRPHQYEFARLALDYTVLSKRKLLELVKGGHVDGWDDPRMPTIAGMRRRGITPEAIRDFAERIGVAKANSRVDIALFEHSIRDDLNYRAPRVMGVLDPLKVTITNYPEGEVEWLDAPYWPHDVPREGSRKVPFCRTIYIERDDFMENPPKKFHRLSPGQEVRLRYAYIIKCERVIKDESTGQIVELFCTYDPESRGGNAPDGRKIKGTIHWVSAEHAVPVEVRLYDRLFTVPNPDEVETDFRELLNPESLVVKEGCMVEPSILDDDPETRYQFERQGYFWRDPVDSKPDKLVFNRIISLRDSWGKIVQAEQKDAEVKKDEARRRSAKEKLEPVRTSEEKSDPVATLSPDKRERLTRYTQEMNLQKDDALILVENRKLSAFFEEAIRAHNNPKSVANWIINEVLRETKNRPIDDFPFTGEQIGKLVELIDGGVITGRIAKDVFAEMLETGRDPVAIVNDKGLRQLTDTSELEAMVDRILDAHPDKREQYRQGKTGLIGFFLGRLMQETGGRANPETARDLFVKKLDA